MRTHEMRDLSAEDLAAQIQDNRKELVQLRFQLAARKLENTAKLSQVRKQLSRLITIEAQQQAKTAAAVNLK